MRKKRLAGRKAEESTETILLAVFYIVIAGTVGLIFMSFVRSIETNTAFEKSYLAKDLSFVSDAIQFAPGDLEFEYNQGFVDLGKFIIDLREGVVTVWGARNEFGPSKTKYRYATDPSAEIQDYELVSPYSVDFGKNGESLFFGVKASGRLQLDCPDLPTPGDWRQEGVVIDPGHLAYPEDKGIVMADGSTEESIQMLELAKTIQAFRSGATLTRDDQPVSIKDRVTGDGILVSLHAAGEMESWENPLIIRFPIDGDHPEESRKLACLVGNEIFNNVGEFTSLKVYPVSVSLLRESHPYKVLGRENIAIMIELGNFQKGLIEQKKNYIADALWEGISKYYS